jgi:hypothetical protein
MYAVFITLKKDQLHIGSTQSTVSDLSIFLHKFYRYYPVSFNGFLGLWWPLSTERMYCIGSRRVAL